MAIDNRLPAARSSHLEEVGPVSDRLTRLARVTAELVKADDVEAVTEVVTSHVAEAAGASIAALTLLDGEDRVRLAGLRGGLAGDAERWSSYPLASRTPASDTIRTGVTLLLTGHEAIASRYPHLDPAAYGQDSMICLPLRVARRTIGAMLLSFAGPRQLDSDELEYLDILADSCAQALDRIRAQDEARQQGAKLAFLADASTELSTSLDYEVTLAKVAELAVPDYADWCAIDVVEGDRLHRVAVAHVDPAKVQLARELQARYPANPDAPHGVWHVLRTGCSELIPEITDDMLAASTVDEEHLRIARELHLRSAVVVPLATRGEILGAITWVWAESERTYSPDDLTLAEDLAKRAATAIDNAELHSETLAAATRLQSAVLPAAMPTIPGWQIANYYRPAGRTDVGGDFYDAVDLGGGRLALFVGDVMGRGVGAAAAMAHMRAATLAYTAVDPTPATVTRKLDLMFAQFPTEQLVTLLYMLVDEARDELVLANAGHPSPVLLRADLSTVQLPLADGSPLGTFRQERRQTAYPFHAGDTVLAFTDGLIERRGEDIDQGQRRVLDALPALGGNDLSGALTRVVDLVRETDHHDDVAALAARRLP